MPCDLTTIQTEACASGIGKVRDKITLLQLIAQLTCEAAEGGGGGGVDSYTLTLAGGWESSSITSVATYFIGGDLFNSTRTNPSTFNNWRVRVPADGIIKTVCLHKMATATNVSGIEVQHSIRINDTTDVAQMNFLYNVLATDAFVDNVNQAVSAGDFIALKIATQLGWGSVNGPRWHCTVLIERT